MTTELSRTMYKLHSNNQIGSWVAKVINNGDGTATLTRESFKVLGGKGVKNTQNFTEGKNLGRSNETSPLQQAHNECQSRIQKQYDKGYVDDIPNVGDKVTNSLGFIKPMLATAIEKVKKWQYPVYGSPKLDGHRMLATVKDGQVVLYSRQGKELSIAHIRTDLQRRYELYQTTDGTHGWSGETLDGEVYIHGETLQAISSLVKKPKPESEKLKYYLYDVAIDGYTYGERLFYLQSLTQDTKIFPPMEHVVLTRTQIFQSDEEVNAFHSKNLTYGYEGTMLRHGDTPYEDGKRSRSLMKKKDFQDAEFVILNVVKGKPVIKEDKTYQVAIYECETPEGKVFSATAPGNMQEKHDAYLSRSSAIGKMLTVKFFNYTPDNIPFLPVAIRLREDV